MAAKPGQANGHEANWQALFHSSDQANKANAINAYLALAHAPEIKGKVHYDKRIHQLRATAPGPYGPAGDWSDAMTAATTIWLQSVTAMPFKPTHVETALAKLSIENAIDPLEDYLLGLQWDGRERLGNWLATYCGAEDNEAASMIGSMFLIGAVARALRPGCQMDYALCLEGAQGRGKSSVVRILGGEYTCENLPDFHSRDAKQIAGRFWFLEIADLAAMRRSELESFKAFQTTTFDIVRPFYGRHQERRPRWCVVILTVNPDGAGYLHDPTGNRRIWPVAIGTLDLAALQRDRDQLFAEAVHCFNRGDPWWPQNEEQTACLIQEQEARYAADELVDIIDLHLKTTPEVGTGIGISTRDIAFGPLKMEPKDFSKTTQMRIASCLKQLGFQRKKVRVHDTTEWRFMPPEA